MVAAATVQVKRTAVFHDEPIHSGNGGGLVVIGAQVHTLYTEALLIGKVFHGRKNPFSFSFAASRTAQSNTSGVTKSGRRIMDTHSKFSFVRIINAGNTRLMPKPFQRRHYIVEVALIDAIAQLAHLNRKRHAIQ